MNITKTKLNKLIKKSEGDIDFLIFLLDEYWLEKQRLKLAKKQVDDVIEKSTKEDFWKFE